MKKKGFTLIELLVVVVIIGVLASIGAVSYSTANKKSRDGKRKADIEQIRAALEMYRADADNNRYPTTGNLNSSLEPTYIGQMPETPKEDDCGEGEGTSYEKCYTSSDGTTYSISITLETNGSLYSKTNP